MACLVASFERARHDRTDEKVIQMALACAQDYMPKTFAKSTRNTAKCGDKPHGGRSSFDTRQPRHKRRSDTPKPQSERWDAGAVRARESIDRLIARPPTLQGLCNRCSEKSLKVLAPKFLAYMRETGDCDGLVDAVMGSVGRTDTYGPFFVDIIKFLRGDRVAGIDIDMDAMTSEFDRTIDDSMKSFVDKYVHGHPYLVNAAPDPSQEYDLFCEYSQRKLTILRLARALVMLGYVSQLAACTDEALDAVQDPSSGYDKDAAVKFVGICASHATHAPAFVHALRKRIQVLCDGATEFNIESKAKFALADLGDALERKSGGSRKGCAVSQQKR